MDGGDCIGRTKQDVIFSLSLFLFIDPPLFHYISSHLLFCFALDVEFNKCPLYFPLITSCYICQITNQKMKIHLSNPQMTSALEARIASGQRFGEFT